MYNVETMTTKKSHKLKQCFHICKRRDLPSQRHAQISYTLRLWKHLPTIIGYNEYIIVISKALDMQTKKSRNSHRDGGDETEPLTRHDESLGVQ